MKKHIESGAHRSLPRGLWPRLKSGVPFTAMALVLAGLVALSGCDKPPTFSELIHGKKKEEPAAPPVAKAPAQTPTPPRIVPPKPPEKPLRAPQEVIAEFNATPAQQRTNDQLQELARTPEAADQFTELVLDNSGVSDPGMAALPKFDRVEKLLIDNCQYSNAALVAVAKMKSLTTLSMNGGVLKEPNCDSGLDAIKQMHQLTSLSLEGGNVTMKGLAHIAEMTWLESLNVARTRFNDDSLKILAPLVNLKELNISYTLVGDSGFENLLPFHEMETLKIARLPIRGDGLDELGRRKAMPHLRNLVMFSIPGLDTSGYQGIYSFRKTLESLDIGQSALTDERFLKAIAPCLKLEVLLVHDNPGLGDGAMMGLSKLKKLKRLYFFKNPGISDQSLPQFAKLRSLESLTLNATNCTERGVRELKRRLKNCDITYNDKKIE